MCAWICSYTNRQIIQHNGEVQEEDFDDELLDDDLMDKISSSPSIDDGMRLAQPLSRWLIFV